MNRLTRYWKVLLSMGIAAIATLAILNYFKSAILRTLGCVPELLAPAVREENISQDRDDLKNPKKSQSISLNLHEVISRGGDRETVELSIEQGADVNLKNSEGQTVLHVLTLKLWSSFPGPGSNLNKIGELLIDRRANVNARDKQGKTVLELALCPDYDNFYYSPRAHLIEFVKLLVERGADLSALNPHSICKTTLLHQAAEFNNATLVQFALDRGLNVNIKDQRGQTPLHHALGRESAAILIANGANINAKDRAGQTPLENSICVHRTYVLKKEVFDFLWANGENFEKIKTQLICANRKLSILNEGVFNNLEKLVELAITKGENLNVRDRKGRTPLHYASQVNAVEAAKVLIDRGANIEAVDDNGYTPLHYAAIHRQPEMVKLLINRRANVDAVDEDGHTPLFEAENRLWYCSIIDESLQCYTPPDGTQETIDILKSIDILKRSRRRRAQPGGDATRTPKLTTSRKP